MTLTLDPSNLALIFGVSAGIIVFGALYASCHVLDFLKPSRLYSRLTQVSYGLLLASLLTLSHLASFDSLWMGLTFTLAIGYFWMPRLILRLTHATHQRLERHR